MKYIISFLLLIVSSTQAQTIKLFGNSAWNVNNFNLSTHNAGDSVFRMAPWGIRAFKPVHISGTVRFQDGVPGNGKIWTDTTGTGVGAWRSASFISAGTPSFVSNANTNDILGVGYSVNITGSGNYMQVVILTGTGISTTGIIGTIAFANAFPSTPVAVYSASDPAAAGTTVGFVAAASTNIVVFNRTQLVNSTTYTYSIHTGLVVP